MVGWWISLKQLFWKQLRGGWSLGDCGERIMGEDGKSGHLSEPLQHRRTAQKNMNEAAIRAWESVLQTLLCWTTHGLFVLAAFQTCGPQRIWINPNWWMGGPVPSRPWQTSTACTLQRGGVTFRLLLIDTDGSHVLRMRTEWLRIQIMPPSAGCLDCGTVCHITRPRSVYTTLLKRCRRRLYHYWMFFCCLLST